MFLFFFLSIFPPYIFQKIKHKKRKRGREMPRDFSLHFIYFYLKRKTKHEESLEKFIIQQFKVCLINKF